MFKLSKVFVYGSICLGLLFSVQKTTALAQVFGIDGGTPTSKLNVLKDYGSYNYAIDPPLKHPSFESYMLMATLEDGICSISGIGTIIHNDRYGADARSGFTILEEQLTARYGNSKFHDFLSPGSIWHDSNEWTMAIFKNERTYRRFWMTSERSTLPAGIKSIMLSVQALGSDETYVTVRYDFANFSSCLAKKRGLGASVL